jgi:hypothetical protein
MRRFLSFGNRRVRPARELDDHFFLLFFLFTNVCILRCTNEITWNVFETMSTHKEGGGIQFDPDSTLSEG